MDGLDGEYGPPPRGHADDAGGADQDQPDGDDDQERLEPQTRQAFNLLRGSYVDRHSMTSDFLEDRTLQLKLRMIVDGAEPLHNEYSHDLKEHTKGQHAMLHWAAARSSGKWWDTCVRTLHLFSSPEATKRLGLAPSSDNPVPATSNEKYILDQKSLVTTYYNFLVDLTANRCWSQSMFSICFPYVLSTVFCLTEKERQAGKKLQVNLTAGILKVELMHKAAPNIKLLKTLYLDIGTNQWPLTREIFITGRKCNYDPDDDELRNTSFAMNAGPGETRSCMEGGFNWLADSKRQSKAQKMAPETKHMYVSTCPYATDGGIQQVRPFMEDFKLSANDFKELAKLSPFKPGKLTLQNLKTPDGKAFQVPSSVEIKEKLRPAGFHANRVSAAACAYILFDAPTDFEHLSRVWAGSSPCCSVTFSFAYVSVSPGIRIIVDISGEQLTHSFVVIVLLALPFHHGE